MFTIIGADGREYGPVSAEQIRQWMAENRLTRDMLGRPQGTTEWKRLGDFPEFAAPVAIPPPPAGVGSPADPATEATTAGTTSTPGTAPATGVPAADPAAGSREPFVFTADWSEYFKIWIVNVLLTIVTLGISARQPTLEGARQEANKVVEALLKTPEFAKVALFRVDFDMQDEVLAAFKVQRQSTLIVFKGSNEVGRSVGDTNPAAIEALLSKAL